MLISVSFTLNVLAFEREMIWPKGKMPDAQAHQIAAMTDEAGAPKFKADKHRVAYLEWFDAPAADVRNGGCMILISGGAYNNCCDVGLIKKWRERFTQLGFQCVNFVYRTPRPTGLPVYQTAWEDGQRAVRIVRREARSRGYEPERIGVLGFSAGAHLSVLLATSSETPAYPRIDETDDIPCHVNFAIPIFPAYVLSDGLEGPNRTKGDASDVTLNPCFKFDSKTCPMCLVHGSDDIFSSIGSVLIYTRLHAMGVSSDLHIYADRGHGFMSDNALLRVLDTWIDRIGDFLKNKQGKKK